MARGKPSIGPLSVAGLPRRRGGRLGWRPSAPTFTESHRTCATYAGNGFGRWVVGWVSGRRWSIRRGRWLPVPVESGGWAAKRFAVDAVIGAIAANGSGCSTPSFTGQWLPLGAVGGCMAAGAVAVPRSSFQSTFCAGAARPLRVSAGFWPAAMAWSSGGGSGSRPWR